MKRLLIIFASLFCWFGLAGMLLFALKALATAQAKSTIGAVLVAVVCVIAFWSFYGAYKKSRAGGASSFADLYEDLAFRFCLTPMLTFGGIMLVATKIA